MRIRRGDIYTADLSGGAGHEQTGIRPVIVIQNDVGNRMSGTVIVAAMTSKRTKTWFPTHVTASLGEGSLRCESVIMLEQIRTVDKSRLGTRIGHADRETMDRADRALMVSLGLDTYGGTPSLKAEGREVDQRDDTV